MAEIGSVSIKISLDDKAIKSQINEIKTSLKDVSKINTSNGTKGLSSGLKQAANSAKTLKREITNVKDTTGKLNTTIKETTTSTKTLANGMKVVEKQVRNISTVSDVNKKKLQEQKQIQKEWATEAKRLLQIDKETARFQKQMQKELNKTQSNAQINAQKQIRNEMGKQKQLQREMQSEAKRLLQIDKETANFQKQVQRELDATQKNTQKQIRNEMEKQKQLQREMAAEAKEKLRIDQQTANFQKQVQRELDKTQVNAQKQIQKEMEKQDNPNNGGNGTGSGLNGIFTTSMKILRVTTTITAIYALIKTAVNAWLKTVKAVFSVYQKLGQVIAGTVKEVSKFTYEFSGAKTVMNAINSVVGEIASKIKEAFSIDSIKTFIGEANELASDLTEVRNILSVIYDNAAQNNIGNWAKNIAGTFGLNELSALEYNTKFGAMLNSTGFDSNTYSAMSKNLTQLTADYASLFNMDYDAVFQKIQSGLAGQTKGMLAFGTSVHTATIEEYLLSKGIDVTWNSLSNATKWYARYAYMIENAKDYQGDFNKTQWQFANNMRVVGQLIETIKMQIGSLINAALTPLSIVLRVVLEEISAVVGGLLKLFNIDVQNSSLMAVGDDYSYMMDEMLDNTNETVKKIKRSLTSFDELHQLNADDDGANGLNGAGIGLQDLIDKLGVSYAEVEAYEPEIVGKIREMIQKIKDAWTQRDFTDIGRQVGQKLKEGFMWINSHWNDIFSVLEGVGKSFATFLNGLFEDPATFTEAARTLAGAIKSIMVTAYGFLANLKPENIGGGIGAFINGIFETDKDGNTLLDIFSKNVALAINNLGVIVETAMSKLDIVDMGTKISNAINSLFENVNFAGLGDSARTLLTKVFGSLAVAFQTINWESIGFKIDTFLKNLFEADENGETFLDCAANIITGFVNGLITAANTVLSGEGVQKMNTEIEEFFKKIRENINWDALGELAIKLKDEISLIVKNALQSVDWNKVIQVAVPIIVGVLKSTALFIGSILLLAVKEILADVALKAVETFKSIVGGVIKNTIGTVQMVWGIITGNFDKFKEGLANFLNGLVDVVGGAAKAFIGVFSPFTDWIDGLIEKIKTFINEMLKVKDLKDTTVNINNHTGGSLGRNIPHYANGGYVRANNPQLAVVGDNRTRAEIISPDDKMAKIFDERIQNFFNNGFVDLMATALTRAVSNAGGSGGTANVYLDGQLIARSVMAEQQINNARGRR